MCPRTFVYLSPYGLGYRLGLGRGQIGMHPTLSSDLPQALRREPIIALVSQRREFKFLRPQSPTAGRGAGNKDKNGCYKAQLKNNKGSHKLPLKNDNGSYRELFKNNNGSC